MRLLIKDIDFVFTQDARNPVLKHCDIGIENDRICFVNTDNSCAEDFKADRIITGRHRLAMPGLVNAHTHSGMTLLRNMADDLPLKEWLFERIIPVEDKLSADDVYWGTTLGIAEMIRFGTTAFGDMYFHMDRVAEAVLESGIRANLCRSPKNLGIRAGCTSEDDSRGCYDYYRQWNGQGGGRIKVYVEVHSVYLFDRLSLEKAASLAGSCGTGIHIHLHETASEVDECRKKYGMSPIRLCESCGIFEVPVIAAHGVHMTDDEMELLKARKVFVAHNPTSNLKLGSGIARLPRMLEKGLEVCLGTDGAASNNNLNLFEEMHLAALIHKGNTMNSEAVSAREVLQMATVNGAMALGFGEDIGCIREGMKADIILLDIDKPHFCPLNNVASCLVYSAQGADVDTVLVDGQILMEKRELKAVDEELAKFKVREAAKRLAKG